jgi:DNA-directed RNA polymerase subunit L
MDYKKVGNQILNLDPYVRFVTIIGINDNKFLFSEHGPGVTNLLTREENDQSLQFTLSAWKIRNTLKKQIGKGKFVLAEYEKIKRISMPLDDNHLLYITTEVGCDAIDLIEKIKKLQL